MVEDPTWEQEVATLETGLALIVAVGLRRPNQKHTTRLLAPRLFHHLHGSCQITGVIVQVVKQAREALFHSVISVQSGGRVQDGAKRLHNVFVEAAPGAEVVYPTRHTWYRGSCDIFF